MPRALSHSLSPCPSPYLSQEQLPELNVHFRSQSFHTSMYASSWFLTLFLTFYPLPVATRIFDIFMYEGLEIIFRVGMAILQYNQTDLIQLDMEGMSQHFQKVIPHQFECCPDKLILRAYQIKYNPKKMKRLEKEYTTIKNKEMEEQIEIKRLRTENRLLKQRIETLEKGQVTRALEAEENYVIKRELAVVRQQCTAASQNLEKAQDTIRELQEHKGDPRYTAEFASHLQTQLEQSRLQEAELLGALRQMQEKVLHMEKRNSLLPDENNMAQLQDELKAVKQREMQTLNSFKEMQSQISDLNEHWQLHLSSSSGGGGHWKESPKKNALNDLQDKLMTARLREAQAQAETRELRLQVMQLESQNQINSNLLNRQEVESAALQEKLQYLCAQNKGLQTQLSEMKRKQAEFDCKSKEEVMAVRLREADSMAAVAELRQRIADLEIQKEEGRIQGQLNNSDSSQYIRLLKDQIAELKTEIRLQKGHQQRFKDPMTAFDGIHIVNHVMGDGDSLSSDEDLLPSPIAVGGLQDTLYPLNPGSACFLRGVENPGKDSDGSTDSEQEERTSAAQLYAHMVCGETVNNVEN
ncbi:EVI5-like protein isoform X2 [Polyodon spathula]|uniref:EVI5-like protein isoform X2 n=1 Tax=Polyodon spathula TaxID=7913 RepID=UPI001B7E5F34|nr:EVI5-like protein isoform X2 [Polyodon spathula]